MASPSSPTLMCTLEPGLVVSQPCGELQQCSNESRYEQDEAWWGELNTKNSSLDSSMCFGAEGRDCAQMSL